MEDSISEDLQNACIMGRSDTVAKAGASSVFVYMILVIKISRTVFNYQKNIKFFYDYIRIQI